MKATIETRGNEHREVKVERVANEGIIIDGPTGEMLIPWHRVWEVWTTDTRGLPL